MPATLTSPTPKAIYPIAGKNYAPKRHLKEVLSRERTPNPDKLTSIIQQKYKDFIERDYSTFTENCDVGRMVSNLRTGKLLLMRHALDGRYLFVKRDGRFTDNKTVGGLFQFYSTKLTSEWLASRPLREPICPSDDDQIEEFIAGVKIIQDYYDTKFFDSQYEELESLSAQDYGTWITRFRFDPDVKDIVCELLDFPACRWDVRFRAEESPYFIYESKCSTAKLQHLLKADIQSDDDGDGHYGLRQIEQLAKTGGNVQGQGKESPFGTYNNFDNKENVVIEMWLQPEEYCDIDLEDSEATVGGATIPAGQSLLDVFPTGLCAVGFNEMKTIPWIYAENHKDHIVTGLYHVQSFSGVGKGISDAVDPMKELNDLHSQRLAHTKAHAMPGFGYNSAVVTDEDARNIGKPRKNIPIDFTNAPDGARTINDVIQAILPGNPAQAAFEFDATLRNDLQMAMQVTDFTGGLPGVDNKTATGAKIGDSNAATLLVPQHLNKADHRKRADKVIYNLFKRFCNKPKFFATKDKNGITKGKYLSGDQFADVDIDFAIVADSERPQTQYEQRDGLSQLFQFTGGLPGLLQASQMNPDITGQVVSAYGVKLSIPKMTDIARVCRKRIEQAKKLLQVEETLQQHMAAVTGEQPDNANLATQIVSQLMPPISPFEPYYQQKASWLAELLDSDELQYAPMNLRHVIEEMIRWHFRESTIGKAEITQDQNIGDLMGQLPLYLGDAAMSQANQQMSQEYEQQQQQQQQMQQVAAQQMQSQSQLQTAAQTAQIQHHQAQAQHQQALAQNDQETANAMAQENQSHQNNLQLEAVKQLGQLESAKNQPKAGTQ